MTEAKLIDLIRQKEGFSLEFKTAAFELPRNVYETVCAMLNRHGGHLLLGVTDNGTVEGVIESSIQNMKDAFVTSVNNPKQLNPKYYLNIQDFSVAGRTVLYCYIPESSQVHTYLGKTFDRNEDGDFDISGNPDLIRQLHLQKQGSFSENIIYPAIDISDLRKDLIQRARQLAENHKTNHPWMEMDDMQMLRSASLWKKDYRTGMEGFTLAAALLLGKDELIHNILPHYKTDAIVRKVDTDHYDDRLIVKTNLLESYDQLMAFIAKHLPDKFYLEKDQRVNVRDKIFREVIANTLIHREFSNEYPAKMLIENGYVKIENWNRPHGSGSLTLDSLSPFPKNPVIANFFREIGRAEELGSGLRNTHKYTAIYSRGQMPNFMEGDTFKITIPISDETTPSRTIVSEQMGSYGYGYEYGTVEAIVEAEMKGLTRMVKTRMIVLLKMILHSPGIKNIDIQQNLGISERTITADMQRLNSLIIYKGSKKSGGYFPTERLAGVIAG